MYLSGLVLPLSKLPISVWMWTQTFTLDTRRTILSILLILCFCFYYSMLLIFFCFSVQRQSWRELHWLLLHQPVHPVLKLIRGLLQLPRPLGQLLPSLRRARGSPLKMMTNQRPVSGSRDHSRPIRGPGDSSQNDQKSIPTKDTQRPHTRGHARAFSYFVTSIYILRLMFKICKYCTKRLWTL